MCIDLFFNIHKVSQPDYLFVWNPWRSFVRRMEMSSVWFHWNTNISIFSWQLEIPHNKPLRRQQDKDTDMHIVTHTQTCFAIINHHSHLKRLYCNLQMAYSIISAKVQIVCITTAAHATTGSNTKVIHQYATNYRLGLKIWKPLFIFG